MPSRRQYLAALSVAGFAGCVSGDPPGGTTSQTPSKTTVPPESDPPTGSPTSTERAPSSTSGEVTVSGIVARKAVRYESVMGSGGVLAGADEQYVVASVDAPDDVTPESLAFVADDRSWSPGLPETAGAFNVSVAGVEGPPLGRSMGLDRPSVVAFTVASPLSASNPRIRFDGGESGEAREWPLPPEARDRLAAPSARFELDSLSVPTSVSQGTPLSVSLTVTNVSGTTGRFLAALYWPTKRIADDDESHVLERVVEAGATTTVSTDIDTADTTYEAESVTLKLRGHVSAEREVRVKNATTPS